MWRGTFLLCVAVSCFMWIKVVRLFLFNNNQFYDSSDCSTVYTFSVRTVV